MDINLTKEQKVSLIFAFKELKKGHIPVRVVGICLNAIKIISDDMMPFVDVYDFVKDFTGSSFPIENGIGYEKDNNKWDKKTKNGRKRFKLLDQMIKYLEE